MKGYSETTMIRLGWTHTNFVALCTNILLIEAVRNDVFEEGNKSFKVIEPRNMFITLKIVLLYFIVG